jgi:hypothetical protein
VNIYRGVGIFYRSGCHHQLSPSILHGLSVVMLAIIGRVLHTQTFLKKSTEEGEPMVAHQFNLRMRLGISEIINTRTKEKEKKRDVHSGIHNHV